MAIVDTLIKKFVCNICGYEWIPRTQRREAPMPLRCPNQRCQRADWNVDRPVYGSIYGPTTRVS
jgi:predicted RNA-binding Zn-ribbon protein involved in translation (DUF1610 family)